MSEYKLTANPDVVVRTADQAYIPNDPNNPDWQQYQAWLADGGVPDPAPVVLDSPQYSWGPTLFELVGGQTYGST